ncbi:MAG: PAS domain-containing protein [Methanomicrobiales archaeon]|nr:PAS domain-containing protein [Methanomicrobiales archaeon]
MADKNEQKSLFPVLALVFFSMLVLMFIYEFTKQAFNPQITIWESHAITIVFTSTIAVIILYFPLRSSYREQQKTQNALRLQKEAEEKLRKSEVQYRSFVESVEDSIYTVDRTCRYLLINARHVARRGLPPDTYIGKTYGDFHSAEETAVFSDQVARVLASRSPVQDEYEQNGKYFLRKLNPVIDPVVNDVVAVTVISSDITERKRTEKNLETINRKLNLMNDITRHDMLNQLTALSSLLTLAEEHADDSVMKRYLLKSEQVVDTIQGQILFARDYQKIGVESPQWQNLMVTIQKARLPLKIPLFFIDEQCSGFEIFADPLLEKVFYNLLDNAMRYAGPLAEIRFMVSEEHGHLLLTCEDNGPGIPPENKEKIFMRGFGKNTGLGLFLIREILSMTGISIWENGESGKGTRFMIRIPPGSFRYAPS